jgi:hypothetical protein
VILARDRRYATNVPAIKVPCRWICTQSLTLVRTKDPVESAAGASVPIVFSLPSHQGKCASPPLSADDYAKAAKTYFPTDTVDDYASIQCGGPPPADAGPDGST